MNKNCDFEMDKGISSCCGAVSVGRGNPSLVLSTKLISGNLATLKKFER